MPVKDIFKAGGSFVELPPQFSSNSQTVYVAWKNQILGYNTKTGILFARFTGIRDKIVGFGVHYSESFECITACSCTGEVITWKVVTFFKLLNKNIGLSDVTTFHVVPNNDQIKFLVSHREENLISFSVYDPQKERFDKCDLRINDKSSRVFVDKASNRFFAVAQRRTLNIVSFDDIHKTYTYCISDSREMTCVACHPDNNLILTGDNTGRVVVWQNLFTPQPTKSVFHWHTLPVRCLGFSPTGTVFYSGGEESVMVKWRLDNSFEKKFLPRLPSTLAKLTVSNEYVAIATNDNAIRIVDTRLENVSVIQHLVIGHNFKGGIAVDPKTKALVMNGNIGYIQFYSAFDNSLLYSVDVVGQNKISNERSCNIENTYVSKTAISTDGLWLATVEFRKDVKFPSEIRLKFWCFDVKLQNFKLNTSVEDPHEIDVNAIGFQPRMNDDLKLVTVGDDKKFKVWYLTENDGAARVWRCLCVGFYHNLPCKDLSFAVDGSLVAVPFGNIVTTWLPDSCDLKCTLSHPICEKDIVQIEFGTSNQCHLIVAASSDRLSVWNLLTLTMMWTVPLKVAILIADTVTTNMAVVTRKDTVIVFSPSAPEPIYKSTPLDSLNGICAAAFVPSKFSNNLKLSWYERSSIFLINGRQELICLGSADEITDSSREIQEISKSLFSLTIPQVQKNKNEALEPVQHLYQKNEAYNNVKKFLEAPVQTMIPVRFMCESLLKSMVLQKC